jgi:hypothetical protein
VQKTRTPNIYLALVARNPDMENVPLDVMDDMDYLFGTLLSSEEVNRGWRYFWSNCELRYREGERDPDCPVNTWRTDIPRRMPKSRTELNFKNEQKRSTRAV